MDSGSAPSESEAARWAPTVTPTREALEGSGVGVLDCGSAQCEVLPVGVHMGDGAEKLITHLGVAPETVLACGDAENDVEMLRLVGLGVAMGNAKPIAMEAAESPRRPRARCGPMSLRRSWIAGAQVPRRDQ